jgi:trehalose 6-phosphate synthase/phosphatase
MNLVAKEYLASRKNMTGVLIISEMAGAAKELGEAITINPHTTLEIAQALKDGLAMPAEEQQRRNQIMQNRLRRYDVLRWASDFIRLLFATRDEQGAFEARILADGTRDDLLEQYRGSKRRLLFLDYDGTLMPFKPAPHLAEPDHELLQVLQKLAGHSRNTVVLVSGRDKGTLAKWFAGMPLHLVAEHGTWVKEYQGEWEMLKPQPREWKARIIPILEHYADRLPGSFIEEKDYSVVWHYRNAHPEQAQLLAGELTDHLVMFTANIDVQVLQGKKVVEVRNAGIHKGLAARHWMSRMEYDFILGIGDDWTDEDLFRVLPASAYSIKVGVANSHARFNLRGVDDVRDLLRSLSEENVPSPDEDGAGRIVAESDAVRAPLRAQRKRYGTAVAWLLGFALYPVVSRLWSGVKPSAHRPKDASERQNIREGVRALDVEQDA